MMNTVLEENNVLERVCVTGDFKPVISLKIPANVKEVQCEVLKVQYALFSRCMKEGHLNMHLFGCDAWESRTVKVSVGVWLKTFSDGRQYMYLDLHKVPETTSVTHRLHTFPTFDPEEEEVDGVEFVFPTPQPIKGCVAFEKIE